VTSNTITQSKTVNMRHHSPFERSHICKVGFFFYITGAVSITDTSLGKNQKPGHQVRVHHRRRSRGGREGTGPPNQEVGGHHALWTPPTLDSSGS